MKIKINYLLIVLVGVISTVICIGSVRAAEAADTKYSYVGDVFYYNSSNLYTSSYSGIGTYYKRLCDSSSGLSKSCGKEAYCVEKSKASPNSGTKYLPVSIGSKFNGFTWNEEKAVKTGEIIYNVQHSSSIKTNSEKYLYTYMAINKFLKFSSNSFSNKYINTIVENASKMTICGNDLNKNLPKPTVTAVKSVMEHGEPSKGSGYFYAKFDLTLPMTDACKNEITYTISTSDSNAKLYYDEKFQNEIDTNYSEFKKKISNGKITLYLKIADSKVGDKDSFSIKVNGSSSETYSVASLWKPVNSSDSYLSSLQALVTIDSKTYPHSISNSASVDVPNPDKRKIKVSKLNEDGVALEGANITLTAVQKKADGAVKDTKTCTISGDKSSCFIEFQDYKDDDYTYSYSIKETSAPDGYILDKNYNGSTTKTVNFNKDGEKFNYNYVTSDGVKKSISVTKSEYSNSPYTSATGVCVDVNDPTKVVASEFSSNDVSDGKCLYKPIHTDDNNSESGTESSDVDSGNNEGEHEEEYTVIGNYVGNACLSGSEGNYTIMSDKNGVSLCGGTFTRQVVSGNSVVEYIRNSKNTVSISKQNINGDEVEGAELKICSKDGEDGFDKKGTECKPASNIDNDVLEWMSEGYTKIWNGLRVGTYYLIEKTPPSGYIRETTAIEFKVKADGTVESNNYDEESKSIIIKNNLNEVTISKQDITDKKELPGAKLYICEASKEDNGKYKMVVDDYGECSPVTLADGTVAEWKSTKEPHKIQGLRPGSYYLVEDKAPLGYLDAESIVFTMNNDGTIGDENGKPIGQNKIVMYDSKNPKTGSIIIIIVATIMVIAGVLTVYFIKKRNNR